MGEGAFPLSLTGRLVKRLTAREELLREVAAGIRPLPPHWTLARRLLGRLRPSWVLARGPVQESLREVDLGGWLTAGLWFVPAGEPEPVWRDGKVTMETWYSCWQAQLHVAVGPRAPHTLDLQIDLSEGRTFRVQALHLWLGRLGFHVFGPLSVDMVYDRDDYTVKTEEDHT